MIRQLFFLQRFVLIRTDCLLYAAAHRCRSVALNTLVTNRASPEKEPIAWMRAQCGLHVVAYQRQQRSTCVLSHITAVACANRACILRGYLSESRSDTTKHQKQTRRNRHDVELEYVTRAVGSWLTMLCLQRNRVAKFPALLADSCLGLRDHARLSMPSSRRGSYVRLGCTDDVPAHARGTQQ